MCLGIPVAIVEVLDDKWAVVDIGGVPKKINVSLVENPAAGEYVILHAGFAITKIDAAEAVRTYGMLEALENGKDVSEFI